MASYIGRRKFLATIGGAAATWPLAARAQRAAMPVIGFLNPYPETDPDLNDLLLAFKLRLRERVWTDGQNLRIDVRFVGHDYGPARAAAAELVALAPAAIVSTTSTTNRALMDETRNIPIIAAVIGDPIALAFTNSMSRPTANLTGFTTFNDTLAGKRLEMLREMIPNLLKAALLWVPVNPQQVLLEKQTVEAARTAGLELLSLPLKAAGDITPALAKAEREQATAVIVAADPLTLVNDRAIIDECLMRNLPAMHTFFFEARHGALMAYGIDISENYRRAADYVDRILRGAKVADLPFQEPTTLTLAVNLRTARAMQIVVPPTLLARADEVIE
jgi:putative tryptophan/tyrosine transport system substrate-binding protein